MARASGLLGLACVRLASLQDGPRELVYPSQCIAPQDWAASALGMPLPVVLAALAGLEQGAEAALAAAAVAAGAGSGAPPAEGGRGEL